MRKDIARAGEIAGAAIILIGAVWLFSEDLATLLPRPSPAPDPPPPVQPAPILGEIPEGAPMGKLVTEWGDPPNPDCRGAYQVGGLYNEKPYYYATIGGTLFYIYYNGVNDWWIADGDLGVPYLYWWYCESATESGDGDYYPYGGVTGYPRVGGLGDADLEPPPPPPSAEAPSAAFSGLWDMHGGLDSSLWPAEEEITLDKWDRALSEPVWIAPRPVGTGEQSDAPEPDLFPPLEEITLDKWDRALSEPVWIAPRPVGTGQQSDAPEPATWPGPPVITIDQWFAGSTAFAPPSWPAATYDVIPPIIEHDTGPLNRYHADLRGVFRIFNPTGFWLYRSNVRPPRDTDTPFATPTSLPATPADTYADGLWYLSVAWFNGVLPSGFLPVGPQGETYLTLEISGGAELGQPPIGPIAWSLQARPGGVVRIQAVIYLPGLDADPDQWAIAYTTNGSTPAADSPDLTQALAQPAIGGQFLQLDLPAQADGTVVKVRVQTRRQDAGPVWVYSDGSTVQQITADATGPSAPLDGETWPGPLPESPP